MIVCLTCHEIFDESLVSIDLTKDYNKCVKYNCAGGIVQLDELIAPVILLLNKKGYETRYCCSGHWFDELYTGYISLISDKEIGSLPDTWSLTYSSINARDKTFHSRIGMVTPDKNLDNFEKYKYILECNIDLFKWATELPIIKQ